MIVKLVGVASLFAAGSAMAADGASLGATSINEIGTRQVSFVLSASCGAGSCGSKDKPAEASKEKTDTKKDAKEKSCGAGSCGKDKKDGKAKKEGSCGKDKKDAKEASCGKDSKAPKQS